MRYEEYDEFANDDTWTCTKCGTEIYVGEAEPACPQGESVCSSCHRDGCAACDEMSDRPDSPYDMIPGEEPRFHTFDESVMRVYKRLLERFGEKVHDQVATVGVADERDDLDEGPKKRVSCKECGLGYSAQYHEGYDMCSEHEGKGAVSEASKKSGGKKSR